MQVTLQCDLSRVISNSSVTCDGGGSNAPQKPVGRLQVACEHHLDSKAMAAEQGQPFLSYI